MSLPYASAGRSETGHVRRHNEDAILLADRLGLWAVADGLGGHAAGDYASALIVERLGALDARSDPSDFMEAIEDELLSINQQLREVASTRQVDTIASTVVLLVHSRQLVLCGWVGDSRAYCFEDGQLRRLTCDHVHGERGDATHDLVSGPAPGALTRAVGATERLFVDWVVCPRRPGMCFVLCSDGVNKELTDAEIAACCRRHPEPPALLRGLVAGALARAGRDNVSAVVVRLDELAE